MMTNFADAFLDWKRRETEFVKSFLKFETKTKAPRKAILLTVPEGQEEAFKDLARKARQEADKALDASLSDKRLEAACLFEKNNPPPRRESYE